MYRTTAALLVAASSVVAGCADIPQLEIPVSDRARAAPYPTLISVEDILAPAPPDETSENAAANFATRSSALRAKTTRLSGDVIAPDDHSRLKLSTANN
jgi:hypothetical protein